MRRSAVLWASIQPKKIFHPKAGPFRWSIGAARRSRNLLAKRTFSMPATWLLLTLAIAAQSGVATADTAPQVANRQAPDSRDLLLFLDDGPLHLRLRLMIAGQSLSES